MRSHRTKKIDATAVKKHNNGRIDDDNVHYNDGDDDNQSVVEACSTVTKHDDQ